MSNNINIISFIVVIMALLIIIVYPTFQILLHVDDLYLFFLMLIFRFGLFFVVFHAIGYWFYRLVAWKKRVTAPLLSTKLTQAYVAIMVPIRNEPIHLVKRMFRSLKEIKYKKVEFIIIDNSTFSHVDCFYDVAREINLSVTVIRKEDTKGFKAGALNKALKTLEKQTKYILVLDIDHAPQPDILVRLVPELEKDQSLAFVQAPQRYDESSSSLIAGAFNYRQRIFYDHICPGLSANETLFFSGTNALFRKNALDDIDGFDETSLTEDLRSSVKLHAKNWRSSYYSQCVALGLPPTDISTYHRQQRRWAIGTYQNLFFVLKKVIRNRSTLTLAQLMLYLGWNGTYYFHGFVSAVLIACSAIFLCLGNHDQYFWTDMVAFPIFFITLLSTMWHERKSTRVKWKRLLAYKSLLFGDAIIHMAAFFDLIASKNLVFEVTKKSTSKVSTLTSNVSAIFITYHIIVAFTVSFIILLSVLIGSFDMLIAVWPVIFFIQAISLQLLMRYKEL